MKKHFGFGLLAVSLILIGCGKEEAPKKPQPSSSGNPVTAPLDYLGAVGKAQQSAVKRIDTVALDQAVQLFNAQEGRLPKDLNELVPNYIAKIPAPPYGMKIEYNALNGVVKVVKVEKP